MLKFKQPVIMLIGRKWIWLTGLVCLALTFGILAVLVLRPIGMSEDATVKSSPVEFKIETDLSNASGENYFVNYRLKREQVRQETKTMLSELLNSAVVKSREQAQKEWLELSGKQQKEEEIENLLKIKGFQDAVADVCPENVTVVIYASSLTPNEISSIQDIVIRVTKVRLDKIVISVKK